MSQLYTTTRAFPAVNNEDDYEAVLDIPIIYRDCPVLHVGAELDLVNDLGLPDDIDNLAEIYLPTARTIRLTLRAVARTRPSNADYYGAAESAIRTWTCVSGRSSRPGCYSPSEDETRPVRGAAAAQELQGIYLQPDPPDVFDGKLLTLLLGQQVDARSRTWSSGWPNSSRSKATA